MSVCSQCGATRTTGPKHTGHRQLPLWSALYLSHLSSLMLCVCACLSDPEHSSFYNGQPSPVRHGRTLRSGRAPSVAVQGEGMRQPSSPATAEKSQEGRRVPWFSGCSVLNPALQPGGRYQGWSDLGLVPIPMGRGGAHSGPFEISNPTSTTKRETEASQGRESTVSDTRVMRKNAGHLSYKNRKKSDEAL